MITQDALKKAGYKFGVRKLREHSRYLSPAPPVSTKSQFSIFSGISYTLLLFIGLLRQGLLS
jgi:hypothetical protein